MLQKKWVSRLIEASIFIVFFIGLNLFFTRNMLPSDVAAPTLQLPQLSSTLPPLSTNRTLDTIQWDQSEKTLVYFFAPWCSVCRVSMPSLSLLPESNTQVIAVALDWETPEQVLQFVDDIDYQGKVLLGNNTTRADFHIDAYPSYYIIDRQGQVLHRDRGFSTPPGLWLRLQ